jgi:hypothetical protein
VVERLDEQVDKDLRKGTPILPIRIFNFYVLSDEEQERVAVAEQVLAFRGRLDNWAIDADE